MNQQNVFADVLDAADTQVARSVGGLLGLQRGYDLRIVFEFTQHSIDRHTTET